MLEFSRGPILKAQKKALSNVFPNGTGSKPFIKIQGLNGSVKIVPGPDWLRVLSLKTKMVLWKLIPELIGWEIILDLSSEPKWICEN